MQEVRAGRDYDGLYQPRRSVRDKDQPQQRGAQGQELQEGGPF